MQEKPDTRTYEQRFKDLDKRVTELEDWRKGQSTPASPPPDDGAQVAL